ncbi:PqqD family peptide modification chaperone [Rhodospirillaceae bacterium SYSU D60014]|uniref:PqqD family peptide modification chaperone n=1 Tax=Virgifigura deserti TaxID=2268457 RepID=UPI000E66E612
MPPRKRVPCDGALHPARGVELHILGEEGILFDRSAQTLYRLNGAATCVWCHLEQESDAAAVAAATARSLGIERDSAAGYVRDIVGQWRDLGLLAGSKPQGRPRHVKAERVRVDEAPVGAGCAGGRSYRLLNSIVSITFSDRTLEERVCPILQHLEITSAAGADIALVVTAIPGRCEVRSDGRILASCNAPEALAPLVEGLLLHLAVRRCRYFIALHAAAVASPEGCLLLPGPSGSGKTTLAAGLADAGWSYMSDDIVLLEEQDLNAVSVPESLCIKEGAWVTMSRRWPSLAGLVPHLRHDGKRARYLAPPWTIGGHDGTGIRVRWIVFPRYRPDAATALRPLTPAEGLQRLVALCSGLRESLDSDKVRRLVGWAAGIDSFEMDVSDLDSAVSCLCALVPTERR